MRVLKLCVLAGLILAVSGTAGAIGLPADRFAWHMTNWDSGSLYTNPDGNIHDLGNTVVAPGAWNLGQDRLWDPVNDTDESELEDSWGVAQINRIQYGKGVGQTIVPDDSKPDFYNSATSTRDLVMMFWGIQDDIAYSESFGQRTWSFGFEFRIWEQDEGYYLPDNGSDGRLGLDSYIGLGAAAANPFVWLEGRGVIDFMPQDPNADFTSLFIPGGTTPGHANVYSEVADLGNSGGAMAGVILDPPFFGPTTNLGNYCDLVTNVETWAWNATNDPNFTSNSTPGLEDNWTAYTSDITVGYAIPEPVTVLGVLMGIGGLGTYIRRRRRA